MSYLCPHQCEGKTEYGYCSYTWCVNPLHNNLGTAQQGQGVQRAVITNADRIRAMTDEELAEFMIKGCDDRECPDISFPADTPFAKDASNEQCRKCWLDWLRQEADNGQN